MGFFPKPRLKSPVLPIMPSPRPRVGDCSGLVAPVVVVPQQGFQPGVAAEPLHLPHVPVGQIQSPDDPLVADPWGLVPRARPVLSPNALDALAALPASSRVGWPGPAARSSRTNNVPGHSPRAVTRKPPADRGRRPIRSTVVADLERDPARVQAKSGSQAIVQIGRCLRWFASRVGVRQSLDQKSG